MRGGEPHAVLVHGAAGIGKTALLQHFLAAAPEVRVLRASGEHEEHLLPYGVVEQLARSARTAHADALAQELRGDRSPETYGIGAAFLELLSQLQEDGPVAVVVDDAQWADRPSLLAVLFALRRLVADRVLALIAARDEDTTQLPEGLLKLLGGERGDVIALGGLDAAELQQLAGTITADRLPTEMAERLRDHTGGSPLHVRALLEELPVDRLRIATDAPLPCPRPFGMQVLSRLGACPPEARRLVLAAAVLGLQCPLLTAGSLAGIEAPLVALEEAMAAGLLVPRDLDGTPGAAFPHALIRAAIYHDIGPARRADLHLGAARLATDEGVALRHRSAAALGEDAALAADLAGYARREAARGAWGLAAGSLVRSSRLSPAGPEREQRLLEAVDRLLDSGDVTRAAALAGEVAACADGPYRRCILGRLAYLGGRPGEGYDLLLGAWNACDPSTDRALASRIAIEIAVVLVRRARGTELLTWSERGIASAREGTLHGHAGWPPLAYGYAYAGRAGEGLAKLAHLPASPRELRPDQIDDVYARGLLRLMTGDLVEAHADLTLVGTSAEGSATLTFRLCRLSLLSCVEYRLGAWDDAIAHGELAASIGEAADQTWVLSWMHAAATAPLAGRGDWEAARAHAEAAAQCASRVRDETSIADAGMSRAMIAAARGDHDAVVAALTPVARMPDREGIDEPGARWSWQELHADALVSLCRLDEAETVLAAHEELATARGLRSAMAAAARVRGNLEAARRRSDAADAAFRLGLEHAEAAGIPFDEARVRAAFGRFLRRSGRRSAAIAQLGAARTHFLRLGARPYVEACEQALAASGVTLGPREGQRATLTPQELAVARLVSQGLSNREVAARLVMSVNTVEYHLKNIYAKLGVFSRRQLPEQLARV